MQLYHGEPQSAGKADEIEPSRPNLAPYPILLRVRYFAETDEPMPAPPVSRTLAETPNYRDASSPPPVRAPRAEPAPAGVEEPECLAVKPRPPAKPTPWARPAENRKRPVPQTHGKLVAFLLLLVIVGLCAHWHALSLVPEYPDKLLSSLHPSELSEEMLVVSADGAPMLVAPEAAPLPEPPALEPPPATPIVPTSESPARPAVADEAPLPPLTPTVTGWPVEPPPMSAPAPIESAVAKPVEPVGPVAITLGRPKFVAIPSTRPEGSMEGTAIAPAIFEQPAAVETNPNPPPVEAELGPDILPIEEGGTP